MNQNPPLNRLVHVTHCIIGWVDIGTRTKVPLRFVTYLSKVTKINKNSVSPSDRFIVGPNILGHALY
jgi:hypothetical protein